MITKTKKYELPGILKVYLTCLLQISFIFPVLYARREYSFHWELGAFNSWFIVIIFATSMLRMFNLNFFVIAIVEFCLIFEILFDLKNILALDIQSHGGDHWFFSVSGVSLLDRYALNVITGGLFGGKLPVTSVTFGFYFLACLAIVYCLLCIAELYYWWIEYRQLES